MGEESEKPRKKKTIGDFFGVDVDGVRKACELGMNPAVTYTVLACFSDGTNRYTPASVQAIEKYTGISRKHATKAINALVDAKLIGLVPRDSTRPYYEIFGAPQAPPPPQARAYGYRREKLTTTENTAFERVVGGLPLSGTLKAAANRAVVKGWLAANDNGFAVREPPPPPPPAERTMVWLPNELVKGIGGTPPIERVRQTSDPLVLQMLVDLYSMQSLRSDGGIDREVLYESYKSECLGSIHEFNVWMFTIENRYCNSASFPWYRAEKGRNIWNYIKPLEQVKLIQWCFQLFDAPDGGLMHALGPHSIDDIKPGDAFGIEQEIGTAAKRAGQALARELYALGRLSRVVSDHELYTSWIIPIARHITKPTVLGIARLRYRPKISDTAKWYGQLVGTQDAWIQGYDGIYQRTLSPSEKASSW